MSKYTTEVRYICESSIGLTKSTMYPSVDEVITKAIPHIFDFNYPIFDEAYKSVLETKILKHYYTREISEESVGLWKLRLNTKLNEIMPYYNKLYESELYTFNPLYSTDITRTKNVTNTGETNDQELLHDITSSTNSSDATTTTDMRNTIDNNSTNTNNNMDLYSDTPQGSITGIDTNTYLTNARKLSGNNNVIGHQTDDTNGSVNYHSGGSTSNNYDRNKQLLGVASNTETYLENIAGYNGYNPSEAIIKYRKSFLNIDVMVINELQDLFFNLW